VAGGGGQFGWRYADIAGVRSPPLQGGEPRPDRLAGRCPGGANGRIAGVQSPPLRETGTRTRRASGFKGEMHR
jgi:hypothetical protein